ncbi:protein kinase [Legionella lytica]|uniref:Protein kinase n=1 Tax=Legionella lytica TaxID=96232 RepID=A0ABW8DDD0_9GAMM
MPFIDLSPLMSQQLIPFTLDKKAAKFLYECKKPKLLPPSSASMKIAKDEYVFSHQLIKSAENQWHVLEPEPIGKGEFGVSYKASFKITLTKEKHNYQAEVSATDEIAKIQRVGMRQISHQELVESAVHEAYYQRQQHVRVSSVINTLQEVITVVDNCGISFDKLLPFKPGDLLFPFMKRVDIALHIANEMFILQQRDMVHCDLKPSNICYKEIPADPQRGIPPGQFQIIFIDFGLARKQAYPSDVVVGTLGYMAPEVLHRGEYSYASDMYSLAGIFAELFGCKDTLRLKEQYSLATLLVEAPYCLDGMFADYDLSAVDPYLLEDIHTLINQMQAKNPEQRPTINEVSKFFTSLRARMDAYVKFCADWLSLTEEFKRLEGYYLDWHFLKERHVLQPNTVNRFNSTGPENSLYNRAMIRSMEEIYQQLAPLAKKPKSHYALARQLINDNRLVDIEGADCPYPQLGEVITTLKAENQKLQAALNCFNRHAQSLGDENKFRGSNSSGISHILKILNSDKSPIEKLCELKAFGQQKTENSWANYYSRSHFFGKGRHKNMEELYQKLNRLTLVQDLRQDAYLEEKQFDALNEFIKDNTFTHS